MKACTVHYTLSTCLVVSAARCLFTAGFLWGSMADMDANLWTFPHILIGHGKREGSFIQGS